MGLSECAVIIFVSLASAVLSEFVSWYFLYATEEYKKVSKGLETKHKQLLDIRRKLVVGTGRKDSLEENAKTIITESGKLRSQLTFRNMLPQFILYLSMMAIYWWISSVYDGEVVALLPFEPFGFFRGVTHRGVEGDNYYHCAVAGIFAMSSMGLRAAFSKIIGHKQPGGGSSSPSLFDMSSFQQQIEDAQNSRRLKTQRRK